MSEHQELSLNRYISSAQLYLCSSIVLEALLEPLKV